MYTVQCIFIRIILHYTQPSLPYNVIPLKVKYSLYGWLLIIYIPKYTKINTIV